MEENNDKKRLANTNNQTIRIEKIYEIINIFIKLYNNDDDINKAKVFLDKHKNNFLDYSSFEEIFTLVNSLKLNENESYYLSYLK